MTAPATAACIAVLASYHPDPQRLADVLDVLRQAGVPALLVDDGSGAAPQQQLAALAHDRGASLLPQPHNLGQAAALNLGVRAARERGAHSILLLDQDSLPTPGMLAQLQQVLARHPDAAAVGARAVDTRDGRSPGFWRLGALGRRQLPLKPGAVLDCDFLMTAGCLLRVSALDDIGLFDARLVIDNVDLDWSFRARALGWRLLGVADAVLDQRIGTRQPGRVGPTVHPPLRLYYMTRNRVHLYRQPHTPASWVCHDIPRLLAKTVLVATCFPQRRAGLAAIGAGLRDGWAGRLGQREAGFPIQPTLGK